MKEDEKKDRLAVKSPTLLRKKAETNTKDISSDALKDPSSEDILRPHARPFHTPIPHARAKVVRMRVW